MTVVIRNSGGAILHSAEEAETPAHAEFREDLRELAYPFGAGRSLQWSFEGIRIMYSEWTYTEPVTLDWKSETEEARLLFNLKGRLSLEHGPLRRMFSFSALQHNLFYSKRFEAAFRNEELLSAVFMIALSPEAYERLTGNSCERLARFGEKIHAGEAAILSGSNGWMDLSMQTAIDAVIHCNYRSDLKKLFLLSKCMELLVLQSASFDRQEGRKFIHCKTDYDRERILFARDYLLQHYDVPPTLPALARIAGINEFKLKKGFRELFNTTVFGYLNDYKMELAKNELRLGQKTAGQLAFDLGYSSLQHFSNAFRKKFGHPPSAFGRS